MLWGDGFGKGDLRRLEGGGGSPQILSTHPSNEARLKALEVFAQRVPPLYEEARTKAR